MKSFEKFEDQIFLNTVLIENLTDNELGTGFLIEKKIDDKLVKQLLFSNKHVFFGRKDKDSPLAEKELRITFHKIENDGSYKLGVIQKIPFHLSRKQSGYFDHPDPSIDVGCLNVSNIYNKYSIGMRSLPLKEMTDFSFDSIFAGQKVVFVGYPKGFFDHVNFLPVMRSGSIASIPSVDFQNKKQLLIDAQVFPGSSGSPVFFQSGINYKLLGMISEVPIKKLDFLEVEVNKNVTTEKEEKSNVKASVPIQFIGLGMLYKYETIQTVYDLA